MARLTAKDIFGIWAGSLMCWDEKFRFDADAYAVGIKQMLRHKPHGIYTTGSTGEFYAIEFDEFRVMVDLQAKLCGEARIPLQIGCCSDATHKTIRLFEYAASKQEVGAAQVTLPYWMELNDREVKQFFKDLYMACPELPIVHYNIPRAKRFLQAADYLKILEVCPSLVGVKYTYGGSHFGHLQSNLLAAPMLSWFVAEDLLVSAMQLGAKGSYSSVIATNPDYMQKLFALASAREWDRAMKMQVGLARFFGELEALMGRLGEGDSDPAVDKAMAAASGFFQSHQRCRPPYIGWNDDGVAALRELMRSKYPELVYPS